MQKRKKNYGENKYDKVMRENLERPSELLLSYFFPGETIKVQPLVPKIRQVILEQESDTLVLLKLKGRKEFILHWEFQTRNDPGMAKRMASYDFMIHLKYGLEVISIVIYTGSAPVNMNTTVNFNGNYYNCKIIDIRDMDPELFLASGNSREVIFAILAGNDKCDRSLIIKEILIKLQTLLPDSESELKERLVSLEILSDLRSEAIQQLLIKEEQKMPIIYDARMALRYQEGVSEGRSEGFSQGESHALLTTARNMIKKGLDIQLIHEITSLPIAKIKKLQKELG